jgi:hypothetical protein
MLPNIGQYYTLYLPFHFGERFSEKAIGPSLASSDLSIS